MHRDLKPENLLLDSENNIKIADFGLSNVMRDGEFLRTSCGSPNYAAPEVISGSLYAGPEVDVWSCGVILYALLCGSLPFDDESIPNLFKKIKSGMYSLPSHLSQLARDLIPRMLVVDPMKRITIGEIRQHQWFLHKLPLYLRRPPHEMQQLQHILDAETIDEVCALPSQLLQRDDVILAIQAKDGARDDLRVAYELILDSKRTRLRAAEVAMAQHAAADGTPPAFSPGSQSPAGGGAGFPNFDAAAAAAPQASAASSSGRRRRWYLGIQSKKDPAHVMTEVYKALAELNCEWDTVDSYRLTVRGPSIEVMLTLYKVQSSIFLLDFLLLVGDPYSFMTLCATIIRELKALSKK